MYVTDILKLCVPNRIIDTVGMNRLVTLGVEDQKHVSDILAPIPPPPTESLDAEKKSRFLSDSQIQENWFVFVIDNPLLIILSIMLVNFDNILIYSFMVIKY